MEKGDIIPFKLNRRNYMSKSFHVMQFMEGQGLIWYLVGTVTEPTKKKSIVTWSQNNSKVVTGHVDPTFD